MRMEMAGGGPLNEALGYIELGLFQEAWEALDRLPPDEKTSPGVMRLRLPCAIHFQRWDMVETLAEVLRYGDRDDQVIAAATFKTLAVIACRDGRPKLAKHYVRTAVQVFPGIRTEILDDPTLCALF